MTEVQPQANRRQTDLTKCFPPIIPVAASYQASPCLTLHPVMADFGQGVRSTNETQARQFLFKQQCLVVQHIKSSNIYTTSRSVCWLVFNWEI